MVVVCSSEPLMRRTSSARLERFASGSCSTSLNLLPQFHLSVSGFSELNRSVGLPAWCLLLTSVCSVARCWSKSFVSNCKYVRMYACTYVCP